MVQDTTWSHTFDFTKNDGGWIIDTQNVGHWQSNTGWKSNCIAAGPTYEFISIEYNFPSAATLTSIVATFDCGFSPSGVGPNVNFIYHTDASTGNRLVSVTPAAGNNLILTWTGNYQVTDSIGISLIDGYSIILGCPLNGDITLKTIVVTGIGINPFCKDECVACAINYIGIDLEEALEGLA